MQRTHTGVCKANILVRRIHRNACLIDWTAEAKGASLTDGRISKTFFSRSTVRFHDRHPPESSILSTGETPTPPLLHHLFSVPAHFWTVYCSFLTFGWLSSVLLLSFWLGLSSWSRSFTAFLIWSPNLWASWKHSTEEHNIRFYYCFDTTLSDTKTAITDLKVRQKYP